MAVPVRVAICIVLGIGSLAGLAQAEDQSAADAEQARIERILELRRELERLMSELSEAARAELESRRESATDSVPGESATSREPVPEPVAPRVAAPVAGPPTPPAPPTADPAAPRCGTLEILDTNGDGVISGADRNWRYLSLWRDDGDGLLETTEVKSLFDHGIRRVSARLFSYATAKEAEGGVWVEDTITFDLPGRKRRAVLTIDAGDLARGDRLWLEDAAGERLSGIQVLAAGMSWVEPEGDPVPVLCR